MSMHLESWQEQLERHYQALATERQGPGLPIFALEHGLTVEETEQIGTLLNAHLQSNKRQLEKYWLLWVIYATEVGYDYEGDEYWWSFEQKTPGWELQHRPLLKQWFMEFQGKYHGFSPTGKWADQFSIIAWPITHAILPKYLQYQFAKALYQLRYRLAEPTTFDAVSIGKLLAIHTHHSTSRLQKFLQQEKLTGRIALGLLDQSFQRGHDPIHPKTLSRIVTDLDRVQAHRWIRETQQTVIDRFKGIGQGVGASGRRAIPSIKDQSDVSIQLDIRPSIFLVSYSAGEWAVAMEVPSFEPVARIHPDLRIFLRSTRCRLAGGTDTKPAGWTLFGNRVGVIKSWPDPDKPLLTFVRSHDNLDRLLQTDCLLSLGPRWLFRIGADGRARQIRSLNVHPGAEYILVTTEKLDIPSNSFYTDCTVKCDGISSVRMAVPENLSADDINRLQALGLKEARTIRVWPAGLPCRSWDGEGQSEWLTTEQPQFGMVHDHPVLSYVACLDEITKIQFNAPDSGEPVFFRLGLLPAGKHRVVITAQSETSSSAAKESLTGYIDLRVREPEPWIPGVPVHTGLVVNLDPHDADLDKFWANGANLSIDGPENYSVTCTLSLETAKGERMFSKQVGKFPLPVRVTTWRSHFSKFLNKCNDASWSYLEASSGTLTIDAGELGQYRHQFDRDIIPVRWITQRRRDRIVLRLIDDTGLGDEVACHFFSMDHPTKARAMELSELQAGTSPEPPGGLFIARNGDHVDSVIISNFSTSSSFRDLEVRAQSKDIENGSTSIVSALRTLFYWKNSRLSGAMLEIRRNKIIKEIHRAVYAKLCGTNWETAEINFVRNPNAEHAVQTLQSKIGGNQKFGEILTKEYLNFPEKTKHAIEHYRSLAIQNRIEADLDVCTFAIHLALDPYELSSLYGDKLENLVHQARSHTVILRGVRYIYLLLQNENNKMANLKIRNGDD